MIHISEIRCPHCDSNDLVKNGKSGNGTQKWQCNSCKKHFRIGYRYKAWESGTKEKIIALTLNSSGVRDIGRILHISKDTVCSVFKKTQKTNSYFLTIGSRDMSGCRNGRILEFRSKQAQSTLEVVCNRKAFRDNTGLA